jgi:hypothetical protein
MKGQLPVSTPEEYLEAVDSSRKTDIGALHAIIRKCAPKFEPFIYKGILGYGTYHYKYASGREGDWFRLGISSNKSYISLYVAPTPEGYSAKRYGKTLGKANIGISCVRFKRLSDLNLDVLKAMLKDSVKAARVQSRIAHSKNSK